MMNSWTNEDIEAIMVQLNNQNFPFKKYEFSMLGAGMKLLGAGASSNVYEAVTKGKHIKEFAIKVIGFGNKHVDSEAFRESVEAQTNLGYSVNNIVKIHDSIELRVWISGEHQVEKVEIVDPYDETKPDGNFLHLQFILMEKISPVLVSHRFSHKLIPSKLQDYDENEIMKMAYEIGMAIDKAHKNNLIHRDIKLENIFYDTKESHYKLGDFGIARTTDDGMASTVAFTKGYGAPEVVGTLDDKYDYTADIYSFGMMLYVLLNEMRFPESNDYHPTVFQYIQGYVPPRPINGSEEFIRIVLKMLSFDPDDRYQSMEEVLNEFDKLKFGHRIKYQKEHKSTALVIGTVFALIGAAIWKMSFVPDLQVMFSAWGYIFCSLCIAQTLFYMMKKKTGIISKAIFGVGMYLMISTGFTWWKLILLFVLTICHYWPGIIGGSALVANVTNLIMNMNDYSVAEFLDYRWMAVLLVSLSLVLLCLHSLLGERDEKIIKTYFGKNMFWIIVTLYYAMLIVIPSCVNMSNEMSINLYEKILGTDTVLWIMSWNPRMVGICGVVFCVVWMVREWFLIFIEKRQENKLQEEQYYH